MTTSLPEPNFIDRDPEAITAEMFAWLEDRLGRPIQPAQYERLLVDFAAYRETLVRIGIQEAAKQCLVRYARFPMLDYLGELKGVMRLDAQKALTTLRFTLTGAQAFDVLVPAGTRVESKDGKVIFATKEPLTIAAGQLTGDVIGVAQTAGVIGNDYLAGAVQTLMDPIAHVAGAANTTLSTGGAELEDDDRYRERILLAPEGYSTAGPVEAYRFHALKASSTIIDVAVESTAPGALTVYPLTTSGNPSEELLTQVADYLNEDKIRPLTDLVEVASPVRVDSAWVGDLIVLDDADAPSVKAEAEAKLAEYAAALRAKLAQDIVPERIEAKVNAISGAYRFQLQGVPYRELAPNEWVNVTSITVNLVGTNNG